jgi:hypothetical protein
MSPILQSDTTSVPVTATLQVHGVPGLTVMVTIPPLTTSGGSGPVPLYTVHGGTLQLNALPASNASTPTILLLNFSQSINGAEVDMETTGRFTYNYMLQVGTTAPPEGPVTFATSASGYTLDLFEPQAQSLQMVGLGTLFSTAEVQFSGNEYYNGIALSNIRVRSASAPDLSKAVPVNGLQQWLRADTANHLPATWKDQSGNGHDANPGSVPPQLSAGGTDPGFAS